MFIFNNSGFTYGLKYDGNGKPFNYKLKYFNGVIEVPYDRKVVEVPDDVDTRQFDRNIMQVFPSVEIPSLKNINQQMNIKEHSREHFTDRDESTVDVDLEDMDNVRVIKSPVDELMADIIENGIEVRHGKNKLGNINVPIDEYVRIKKESGSAVHKEKQNPKPPRKRGRPAKRKPQRKDPIVEPVKVDVIVETETETINLES